MRNLLKNTGIEGFFAGQNLSEDMLNSMNKSINDTVELVNLYLRGWANINIECSNLNGTYSAQEAIDLVPEERRVNGITVEFRETKEIEEETGRWTQITYCGGSFNKEDWQNLKDKWVRSGVKPRINGGEF